MKAFRKLYNHALGLKDDLKRSRSVPAAVSKALHERTPFYFFRQEKIKEFSREYQLANLSEIDRKLFE